MNGSVGRTCELTWWTEEHVRISESSQHEGSYGGGLLHTPTQRVKNKTCCLSTIQTICLPSSHFFISATDFTRLTFLVSKVQVNFFLFFYYVFIVCIRSWALRSSLQVCGIFGCCLAGSGSLTRNQTGSLPWENKLLATGPPGKALKSLSTSLSSSSRSCHLHSNTAKPLARMFLLSFLFYFPPS